MLHEESSLLRLPSGGALHDAGKRDGVPLLFLHGVGGGAWSWRHQTAAFAATQPVFAWDARGHGDADRVDDAGLADYYADAREALAVVAERTHRPAILVGHSMGGLLAVALACDEPSSVKGLFLVDPVYSSGEDYGHFSPGLGRAALFLCSPLLRSFERNGRASRVLSRWMFEHSFEDRVRMEETWPDQQRQIPIEYPRMLRESFGKPTGFELRDFALEIEQPTYLLEGSFGRKAPRFPKLVATLERRLGPAFVHEAIAGGHYLQADRPEQVNQRLANFVATYA
jgi:pimeloyl-ACP methyl ester carboxylesterase